MSGQGEQIFQSVPIPEYKTGWIIGKRGSYIKQLEKKSGATITISDSTSKEYGTVWKYIQITGNGRAVDRVKKLLHIRLERLEPGSVKRDGEGGILDDCEDDMEDFMGEEFEYPPGATAHSSAAGGYSDEISSSIGMARDTGHRGYGTAPTLSTYGVQGAHGAQRVNRYPYGSNIAHQDSVFPPPDNYKSGGF